MVDKNDKPNIVFIWSDQQRQDTLECYGNDWIKTPRLNELANNSYVIDNAYCTQPVCAPARSSVMTGLYPHAAGPTVNKIPLKQDVKTIAEILEDNDYRTGHLGKWHLGDDTVKQRGFDEWVSVEDHTVSSYYDGELPYSDLHNWLVEKGHTPTGTGPTGRKIFDDTVDLICQRTVRWLHFLQKKLKNLLTEIKRIRFFYTLVHLSLILLMAVHLMECTTQINSNRTNFFKKA